MFSSCLVLVKKNLLILRRENDERSKKYMPKGLIPWAARHLYKAIETIKYIIKGPFHCLLLEIIITNL